MSNSPGCRLLAGNLMRRLLAVMLLAASVASQRAASLETYQAIHAPLECETAAISPDGKWIAAIVRTKDAVEVRVIEVDEAAVKTSVRLKPELAKGVTGDRILWASATRIVAQLGMSEILAIDADGKNQRRLIDWEQRQWYDDTLIGWGLAYPRYLKLIAWSADEPDFIHVDAAGGGRLAVARIHHGTGKVEVSWEGEADDRVCYDRLGSPRVRTVSRKNPEGFEVRVVGANSPRWMPLDRALGSERQPQFNLTAANVHGPRSIPLGVGRDPDVLFFASNVGRDTFGIYAVDLRTKQRTGFALEHPTVDLSAPFPSRYGDPTLVYERQSGEVVGARLSTGPSGAVWADPELRLVQDRIERIAPNQAVRIENWDDARERFLVRLSHRGAPGGFAIYTRSSGKLRQYIDRANRVAGTGRLHSTAWTITRKDGTRLTGRLTMPASGRGLPTPVVVYMQTAIWGPAEDEYSPLIHAIAQMGYAVLEVAHRGTLGQGLRHWEAGRLRLDHVAAEDVVAALDVIAAEAGLESSKVALMGLGFGGTLA